MMHPETTGLARVREIATVLQRAFLDDPFYAYAMPDPGRRARQLDWWMACLVRYGSRSGRVYTTPEPIRGAAIWLPPSDPRPEILPLVRAGLIQAPLRLGVGACLRLREVNVEWEELHRREAARHWYLMLLAVDPAHQGGGLGGSLLRPVLEEADRTALACYVETMTEKNVAFYRRHGFEVVHEGRIRNGAPYWAMRRSPRS